MIMKELSHIDLGTQIVEGNSWLRNQDIQVHLHQFTQFMFVNTEGWLSQVDCGVKSIAWLILQHPAGALWLHYKWNHVFFLNCNFSKIIK